MSTLEKLDIHLRRETDADHAAVEDLTRRAFWNVHRSGCDEHYLVHVLRTHPDFRPDLDFVAEVGGRVVGKALMAHPAALLVRALRPEALAGRAWTFQESAAYHLDPQAAEAYDARFPPLEKAHRSSQEVFAIPCRSYVE